MNEFEKSVSEAKEVISAGIKCDECESKGARHKKGCSKDGKPAPRTAQDNFLTEVMENFSLAIQRMDGLEKIVTAFQNQLATLEESIKKGSNVEFERELKNSAPKEKLVLSAAQQATYGTDAPARMVETVNKVLGVDFTVLALMDGKLPQTFITIVVPKRLAEKNASGDLDFRSRMIPNVVIEHELKRFCEAVKRNIFRQFASQASAPEFFI